MLFGFNESTYYYQCGVKSTILKYKELLNVIQHVAALTGSTHGRRRMNVKLKNRGYTIGIYKTASLMKKVNVVALTPSKSTLVSKFRRGMSLRSELT